MRAWFAAQLGALVGVVLVALVAVGTIVLSPVVAQALERMPWLIYLYTEGEPVRSDIVREQADPLPLEIAGITGEQLVELGIPVDPTPTFHERDAEGIFPSGHFVTEAGDDLVMSARRALWVWDTGEPGLGVEVMTVELPTAGWASSLARIWAANEPSDGEYPPQATVSSESGDADEPYERAAVQFVHDRLWVVVQLGVGPAYLSAVDAGATAPLDVVDLTRQAALIVHAGLPELRDLEGWETLPVADVRPLHAASFGVAAVLAILVRELGAAVLDRGSREAFAGQWRRRVVPRERDVNLLGSGRRSRMLTLLKTIALALAAGVGAILLYFGTGALDLYTMFFIAGAIIVVGSVAWAFLRRGAAASVDLPGGWRWAEAGAATGSGVVLAAGVFCIGTAGIGFATGDALIVRLVSLVMLVLGLAVVGCAAYPPRLFKRLVIPAIKRSLEQDDRAPALFLRSFQDDDLRVRIRPNSRAGVTERIALLGDSTFEDLIAWIASRTGPVIAIGQPGTVLQPLGAVRDYFSDDEWQSAILKRINTSAAVVFVVGRSPGAQWELAQLRDRGALAKTVFVFPPVGTDEFLMRCVVLAAGLGVAPTEFFGDIDSGAPLAAVRIDEDGQVVRYLVDGRDDVAYSLAIERALADAAAMAGTVVAAGQSKAPDPEIAAEAARYLVTFSPSRKRSASTDPFRRALGFFIDLTRPFI